MRLWAYPAGIAAGVALLAGILVDSPLLTAVGAALFLGALVTGLAAGHRDPR